MNRLLLLSLALMVSACLYAQTRIIKGQVNDDVSNEPLSYVSVYVVEAQRA